MIHLVQEKTLCGTDGGGLDNEETKQPDCMIDDVRSEANRRQLHTYTRMVIVTAEAIKLVLGGGVSKASDMRTEKAHKTE